MNTKTPISQAITSAKTGDHRGFITSINTALREKMITAINSQKQATAAKIIKRG